MWESRSGLEFLLFSGQCANSQADVGAVLNCIDRTHIYESAGGINIAEELKKSQ